MIFNISFYLLLITSVFGSSLTLINNRIYFFHIALLIYVFLKTTILIQKRKIIIKRSFINKYIYFFIIYFIWIILSVLWAESLSLYIHYSSIYFIMFILMFTILIENKDVFDLNKTLEILNKIFLISISIALFEIFLNLRLPSSRYYGGDFNPKPTSFFYNPNDFATYIMINISYLLALGKKNNKYLYYSSLVVAIYVLIKTNSRANIMSLIIVLIVYMFIYFFKNFKYKKNNIIKIIVIVFLLIIIITTNNQLLKIIEKPFNLAYSIINNLFIGDNISDNSANIRTNIFKNTIQIIKDNPFGVGVGNLRHHILSKNNTNGISTPHNWWLEVLGDMGVFVFFIYISFYISLLFKLLKNILKYKIQSYYYKVNLFAFLFLVSFVLGSMSPSSVIYFIPHWIYMGIVLKVIQLSSTHKIINYNLF